MKVQAWVAALAGVVSLAGCGGGGGGGAAEGASAAAPQSAALDVAPGVDMSIDFTAALPVHFEGVAALDNTPPGAISSNAVASLGRVLFYDKRMSINDSVSCASCHNHKVDFADSKRFSDGFAHGTSTTAHAMRLANLRFFKGGTMFWDKRAPSLEKQASQPLQHPIEMGFDEAHGGMPALVVKMQGLPMYPELFTQAYGDSAISEERIQQALSQFMRAIVSSNSRWDTAYAQVFDPALPDKGLGLPLPGFTAEENRGRHLFMASRAQGGQACAACHVPPSFALGGSGNNGLDAGETQTFKSPSLKNVARSSAFMHDGRFSTLEEVVEHYNSGVKDGPGLDRRLEDANGQPLRPNLSQADKAALVAFLRTLDDPVLAADPRFSDPFR